MNILLIEDNAGIINGLKYALEKESYCFSFCTSLKDARDFIEENNVEGKKNNVSKENAKKIDLILLDIMLPDGNGVDFYNREIKKIKIPTIFLTAKDGEDDIVKGLEIGAEDYITKPFSTKELLARIKKVILRNKKENIIVSGNIKFDMYKAEVYKEGTKIELSPLELKILNLLFLKIGSVVTREVLLDKIWEWTGNDVDNHTLTVYLQRIRNKLGTDIIKTVKGVGYRIDR